MRCNIIVEDETDVMLVWRAISTLGSTMDIALTKAGSHSRASSMARSRLAVNREPVCLMLDADSYSSKSVELRRLEFEESLGQFAGPSQFKVLLFVPEMEVTLFHDLIRPRWISDESGQLTPDQSTRTRYEPRSVFRELAQKRGLTELDLLRNTLSSIDPAMLAQVSPLDDLREFILSQSRAAA